MLKKHDRSYWPFAPRMYYSHELYLTKCFFSSTSNSFNRVKTRRGNKTPNTFFALGSSVSEWDSHGLARQYSNSLTSCSPSPYYPLNTQDWWWATVICATRTSILHFDHQLSVKRLEVKNNRKLLTATFLTFL